MRLSLWPQYPYTPLDPQAREFRVLRVHPLSHTTPVLGSNIITRALRGYWRFVFGPHLLCSLEVVSLDDNPVYTAISYTWGSKWFQRRILLDGHVFWVTRNAYAALERLRGESGDRTVWMDAICINQNDKDGKEKEYQVQKMMGRIYQSARQVAIWLGYAGSGSDELVDLMATVGSEVASRGLSGIRDLDLIKLGWEQEASGSEGHETSKNPGQEGSENAGLETSGDATDLGQRLDGLLTAFDYLFPDQFPRRAYRAFCARTWWTRVWVVQELALGRDPVFLCGTKSISFEKLLNFSHFLAWYAASSITRTDYPGAVGDIQADVQIERNHVYHRIKELTGTSPMSFMLYFRSRYVRRTDKVPHTLYSALKRIAEVGQSGIVLNATKEQDKIYGLLGIAEDFRSDQTSPNPKIKVSYSANFSPLTDVSRAILLGGELELLALCQTSPGEDAAARGLPSWACTWHRRTHLAYGDAINIDRPFNVAGATVPVVAEISPFVLSFKGFRMSTVARLSAPFDRSAKRAFDARGDLNWTAIGAFVHDIARVTRLSGGRNLEDLCRVLTGEYCMSGLGAGTISTPAVFHMPHIRRYWSGFLPSFRVGLDWVAVAADLEDINATRRRERGPFSPQLAARIHDTFERMQRIDRTKLGLQSEFCTSLRPTLGRRAWSGEDGRVGLGPPEMREGDVVCALHGSALPFVLRPIAGAMYELIGEAYVLGAMDGELADGRFKDEYFQIC